MPSIVLEERECTISSSPEEMAGKLCVLPWQLQSQQHSSNSTTQQEATSEEEMPNEKREKLIQKWHPRDKSYPAWQMKSHIMIVSLSAFW